MEYKRVEVNITDPTLVTETISVRDLDKYDITKMKISGYLIREDKDQIVIACALYSDGQIGDFYIIPKGNIIEMNNDQL